MTRVGRSLSFGAPVRLFDGRYNSADPGQGWDVAPDGSFLVIKPAGEAETRAFWEKVLSSRIVVDTGGVARLVAAARVGS